MLYRMSTKIYNGIGDLPKGKRYGTPQEALEMKQVRRYGKLKIDPRIVDKIEKKEVIPETREKLLLKFAALKGSIRRNKGRYETTKQGDAAKAQYYDEWQKAVKEAEKIIVKLKKIEGKIGKLLDQDSNNNRYQLPIRTETIFTEDINSKFESNLELVNIIFIKK